MAPPTITPLTSSSLQLTWFPPEVPNGVILTYSIYRDGVNIATTSTLEFVDTALAPATQYSYFLEATNVVGTTRSSSISAQTLEGIPNGLSPPVLTAVDSSSVSASWSAPAVPNGDVSRYELLLSQPVDGEGTPNPGEIVFTGLALEVTITGLTPFTVYSFVLRACTSGGCGSSPVADIQTGEASPTFQPAPNVTAISAFSVRVSWDPPPQPNGIITQYMVYQRNEPFSGSGLLVHNINGTIFHVVVSGLYPYTEYEFSVSSSTSVGAATQSEWTRERTAQSGTNVYSFCVFPNVIT